MGSLRRLLLKFGTLTVVAASLGCSDVSTKHVGISIVDGFVTPGENVRLAIGTRRAMAGNVSLVRASWPAAGMVEQEVYVPAAETAGVPAYLSWDNKLWSMLCSTLIADPKHPVANVTIPLPTSVRAVGKTDCAVEVTYSLAEWSSPQRYDVNSKTETLLVPLEIVEPGREWQAWLIHGGTYVGLLLLLSAAFGGVLHFIARTGVANGSPWSIGLHGLLGAAWLWGSVDWAVWPICARLGLAMPLFRLTLAAALPTGALYLTFSMAKRLARRLRSSSLQFKGCSPHSGPVPQADCRVQRH